MQPSSSPIADLVPPARSVFRRLLTIGENRIELLLLELQEERERLVLAIMLALGAAVFVLLAGVAVTAVVALVFWNNSPIIALSLLFVGYLVLAGMLYGRLNKLCRDWQTLPATLDQLKKDRACLEPHIN